MPATCCTTFRTLRDLPATEDGRATGLGKGEVREVGFVTLGLCNRTGIFVEAGARYHVEVKATSEWSDGGIPTQLGGFYTTDAPAWYQRVLLMLAVPLRRELTRPWFRLVLRYGETGGEEVFLDPDPEDRDDQNVIRPTRKGELFIFVNDVVIGIPGLYDVFYRNNKGTGT